MQTSPLKSELRRLLEFAHERQLAQIAALPEDERNATGTPEHWSAKDHLAHTMMWKERLAIRLAAAARDETPTLIQDYQPVNEANFEHWREQPRTDVLAEDSHIHAELLERLDALADDALLDPARFAWRAGEPLLADVLGNPYWHVQEHLAQYARDRGDLDGAVLVNEEFTAAIVRADLPPIATAYARYNLACFYASIGRNEPAIANLAEALRLHPNLIAWSKEDPDLVRLRDEPGYQALYAGGIL